MRLRHELILGGDARLHLGECERLTQLISLPLVLLVSNKATLRVITCALLGLDVRLFRERIAQPVGAVTMFAVTGTTAFLTLLGDRTHLSEELKNQKGT